MQTHRGLPCSRVITGFMSYDQMTLFIKTVTLNFVSFLQHPCFSPAPFLVEKTEALLCEFPPPQLRIPVLLPVFFLSFSLFPEQLLLLCQASSDPPSPASAGPWLHSLFPFGLASFNSASTPEPCLLSANTALVSLITSPPNPSPDSDKPRKDAVIFSHPRNP